MAINPIVYKIGKSFMPKSVKAVLNEIEESLKPDSDKVVRLTFNEIAAIGVIIATEICRWRGWKTEIVIPQGDE